MAQDDVSVIGQAPHADEGEGAGVDAAARPGLGHRRRALVILLAVVAVVLVAGSLATTRLVAPWCASSPSSLGDLPASPSLGVPSTGGRSTRDDASVTAAVERYVAEHPDEAAGMWNDPEHGDALVVAFTGHLDEHRAAVAALRPTPADLAPSAMVPTTVPRPAGVPTTTTAPGVAEAAEVPPGWPSRPVYVVAQPRSEAELRGIQSELIGSVVAGEPVNAAGFDVVANRATVGFAHVTLAARWELARRYGADRVCVSEGTVTAVPG